MTITNHIKLRYAERIARRDTKIDINTYVAQNEEKIEKDISTMIDHSEIIYTGITTSTNKDVVNVRLSGTWVIIMDQSDRTAITLYKVDFGLGEEFNKTYVSEWLKKLSTDKDILAERESKTAEEIGAYKQAILDNQVLIDEYKALAKQLSKSNEAYQEIIDNKRAEFANLQMDVRRDIEALTRRREF